MAFDQSNLSVLTYANGFTLWHYRSDSDENDVIDSTNYFQSVVKMMNIGDMILVNSATSGGLLRVIFNNGSDIDTADMLTIGATDTR